MAVNSPPADGVVSPPDAPADGVFAEALSAQLAARTLPEGGGQNPGRATAGGNGVTSRGQVLPEPSFAAISGAPAGDGAGKWINLPPGAADKDLMRADGTMDNAGGGGADHALSPQLPLPVSAAAQAPADNVVVLRPGGAETSSRDLTILPGLTQDAAQADRVEGAMPMVQSEHGVAAPSAQANTGAAAQTAVSDTDQINAPLLAPANSPASSNELVTAGAVTATPVTQQVNPAPVNAPVSLQLPLPLEQRGWSESLGHRVLWMVKQDHQIAQLRLNPPHLGPLELRVSVEQDEASIAFSAQHPAVRDALEAALPKLREMLNASGLTLGQVNISQQSFAEQRESRYGGDDYPRGAMRNSDGAGDETPSIRLLRPADGVIDLYA
jgi:flagellar hook-length control protein FliK